MIEASAYTILNVDDDEAGRYAKSRILKRAGYNVIESDKGLRLGKTSRQRSAQKIDLAACLVMAHSRCTWLAMNRKRKRYASFAS